MWTPTALASEARAAKGTVWRAVEDQHRASTRKLVDTLEEHDLLETLLDADKPPYPPEAEGLHYLLKTPFRYHPPAPHGSRFRRYLVDSGVFYASEQIRTALAEFAYWRLKFFRDAPEAALPRLEERLTVFSARYATQGQLDLTRAPLNKDRKRWIQPDDYGDTQALAERARQAGIEVIRYESVRDAEHEANLALLTAMAFVGKKPQTQQTWFLYLAPTEINFTRAHTHCAEDRWVFPVAQFA
jgi:hypothetical protein